MARRCLVGLCLVVAAAWLFPAGAAGQAQGAASDGWTASRTAWGDPDLEGAWSFATITPLERPGRHAGRDRLTAEEVTALNQDALTRGDQPPPPGDTGAYNAFWFDRGESTGRTSLIVDPPDGRIPFTAVGSARRDARRALLERPAHGPEDRTPGERCVHHSKAGPPMSAGGYNNHLRVLQAPGHVVIWTEQNHDARIVPLDGRPRIADAIRQWMGDSRGRWEGDTLVVETTNFNGKAAYQGSADGMQLVERFTRTAPDTIRYNLHGLRPGDLRPAVDGVDRPPADGRRPVSSLPATRATTAWKASSPARGRTSGGPRRGSAGSRRRPIPAGTWRPARSPCRPSRRWR